MCRISTLGLVVLWGSLVASTAVAQGPAIADQTADPNFAAGQEEADASWGWFPKPQITWPQVTLPSVAFPKFDRSMTDTVFAPVKSGAAKISAGSRRAWDGAKEIFSFAFGDSKDEPRVASRQAPSMWERMFGGTQDPGPQTIGEFMSGTRPQ